MGSKIDRELTDKNFWDVNWDQTALQGVLRPFSAYKFCRFHEVLQQHLPAGDRNIQLLEVGCVPGRHLVYFQKVFGYYVEGVDFSDHIGLTHDVMKYHNIVDYRLYQDDFLGFQHDAYDIVASFGFLEHFTSWQEMLQKHIQLVKPGGYLVISVPNLRNFQYLLHKWLDPVFENEQVVESTDLGLLQETIRKAGLTILHAGYYQTFHFYCHHRKTKRPAFQALCIKCLQVIGAIFTRFKVNIPSKHFSPQVICIARNDQ